MKDLAVLIPAYNDGPELLATLDSIDEPEQSFTVFVVDDGSQVPVAVDSSRYAFDVRVIQLSENRGIVGALNAGLKTILQENFSFIARLDAADRNRPHRFHRQYLRFQANAELSLVGGNVVFRREEDDTIVFETNLPLTDTEVRRRMTFQNCFIHPSVMFRVELIEKVGLYSEKFRHIEDYELFTRMVDAGKCENLPLPLVDCAVRGRGISLSNERAQLLAGIRFRLSRPKPLNPLWYAFFVKRLSYFVLPMATRNRIKAIAGFVKVNRSTPTSCPS